jgi:hypothetical protein
MGCHVSTVLHHRFKIPTYKTQKSYTGKDVGPTHGLAASPGVGPGATVGTLRTGYPRVQAPSQDKSQGSSEAVACPHSSGTRFPSQGSSEGATCRLGSSTSLLAQGSSGAAMCPVDVPYKLQAIKQVFPGDPAIMILIGVWCVSTKTLRDKGCSARLQGIQ